MSVSLAAVAAPRAAGDATVADRLSLWEWRRRVSELYAEIRVSEPQAGWRRWRAVRDELFRNHPQSPLGGQERAGFPGISYFGYDPALRFLVALGRPESDESVDMAVGRDGEVSLRPFARTCGLAGPLGAELTLYWIAGYGGGVFLPFADATSGQETYAGGRYLLDTIKGADLGAALDGRTVLDFNFAYNPSCSYSDEWVCPLAPAANTLPKPVRAGERTIA